MEQLVINLEKDLVAESDTTPPDDLYPRLVDCMRNPRLFKQHFDLHRPLRWRKTRYTDLDEDLRSGIDYSNYEDMEEEMRGYYDDFKEKGAPSGPPDDLHDLAAVVGNLRMTESRGAYPRDRLPIPFTLVPEYWAVYDTENRMNAVIMFVETRVYYINKELELAHEDYTRFVIVKRSKETRDQVEYYSHYLNWVTYRLGSRGMFPFMPMSDNFLVGEDFIEYTSAIGKLVLLLYKSRGLFFSRKISKWFRGHGYLNDPSGCRLSIFFVVGFHLAIAPDGMPAGRGTPPDLPFPVPGLVALMRDVVAL